uniref:PNPLA domain-containing protein n=1 Tax=Amazona collaria TaxID=241587 RepID=A0A8B9GD47_9PSIT
MAEEDLRGLGTPFSLSFSGSGFLALYQVGVVQSLLELAPELLKSACKVYGSSAGSLIAAAVVCGIGLGKTGVVRISLLWGLLANIKAVLQRMLPENSYQLASGRLHISLTRVVDGQNVMASEFSSKEELIQALLCSCFLPIYCGFIPPSYRGVRYVDGGFTGLQPVSSLEEPVITVSPFTGELDICPRDCPAIFFCFQIFNGSIQISIENLCRISYALFPPSTMVSQQLFFPALFWLKQIDALPAFLSFEVSAPSPSIIRSHMEGAVPTGFATHNTHANLTPFFCVSQMPLALTTAVGISASPAHVGRMTLPHPRGRALAYAKWKHSAQLLASCQVEDLGCSSWVSGPLRAAAVFERSSITLKTLLS